MKTKQNNPKNTNKKYTILFLILIIYVILIIILNTNYNNNYKSNENNKNYCEINYCKEFRVVGTSMLNTLINKQIVNVSSNKKDLKKKDIIIFKLKTKDEIFVKRIIAMENDKIIFDKNGYIYINNVKQIENYILENPFYNSNGLQKLIKQLKFYNNIIPKGYVLVFGDNRKQSIDSSSYGLIPERYIIGKVIIN